MAIEFVLPNFTDSLKLITSFDSCIFSHIFYLYSGNILLNKVFLLVSAELLIEPKFNSFSLWTQSILELDWSKWILNEFFLDDIKSVLDKCLILSPKQDGFYKIYTISFDHEMIKPISLFYSKILACSKFDTEKDLNINSYLNILIKLYLLLPSPLPSWFIFLMDSILAENHPLFKRISAFTVDNYEHLLTNCSAVLYSNFSNLTDV